MLPGGGDDAHQGDEQCGAYVGSHLRAREEGKKEARSDERVLTLAVESTGIKSKASGDGAGTTHRKLRKTGVWSGENTRLVIS